MLFDDVPSSVHIWFSLDLETLKNSSDVLVHECMACKQNNGVCIGVSI